MKELNIDLLRTPGARTARKIIGIIFLGLAILWTLQALYRKGSPADFQNIRPFDILYILVMLMTGTFNLIEGSGKSVFGMFGESYIRINEDAVCIKKGLLSKEWKVKWEELTEAEFTMLHINFTLKSGKTRQLSFNGIDDAELLQLKKIIKEIADIKNIKSNRPN
jgi:hypothetical protein